MDLRKQILQKRAGLAQEEADRKSAEICHRLLELQEMQQAQQLLLYHPLAAEVSLLPLYHMLLGQPASCRCFFPVTQGDKIQFFEPDGPEDFARGAFGVCEPVSRSRPYAQAPGSGMNRGSKAKAYHPSKTGTKNSPVDVILVPGVVFGRNGERMGYGKGYYDRFLEENTQLLKIGICFELQMQPSLPQHPWDVAMDLICTEHQICHTVMTAPAQNTKPVTQ